jgi:hypothetical protein
MSRSVLGILTKLSVTGGLVGMIAGGYIYNLDDKSNKVDTLEMARFVAIGGVCGMLWPIYIPLFSYVNYIDKKRLKRD